MQQNKLTNKSGILSIFVPTNSLNPKKKMIDFYEVFLISQIFFNSDISHK